MRKDLRILRLAQCQFQSKDRLTLEDNTMTLNEDFDVEVEIWKSDITAMDLSTA